ncbi:MAG: hypothetical protein IJS16_05125 [Butyrivibrio sp.]|nr:hypothetical protein [Butyrivibrio sp.]
MDSYNDIITDMTVTDYIAGIYYEMTDEEKTLFQDIYNRNDLMISNWLGIAGDAFKEMAGTIELELEDVLRFTGNCYETTDKSLLNASRIDNDVADSIVVNINNEEE